MSTSAVESALANAVKALLENAVAISRIQQASITVTPAFAKQFPDETMALVESRVHCEQAKESLEAVMKEEV